MAAQTYVGVGRAHASCGELVQGQLPNGEDFLITLPVDLWSTVNVTLRPDAPGVFSLPRHKRKTRRAVERTLALFGCTGWGADITVSSAIPEGKGLASSTADIVAASRAVADALGEAITQHDLSRIAIAIEPSDGLMFDGTVIYNHRQGKLLAMLGFLPPLHLLLVDFGGQVDTVRYNRQPRSYTCAEQQQFALAVAQVAQGIRTGNLLQVGLGARTSATINQRFLPRPELETLELVALISGAAGVFVAHSGSVAGLMYPASGDRLDFGVQLVDRMMRRRRFVLETLPQPVLVPV